MLTLSKHLLPIYYRNNLVQFRVCKLGLCNIVCKGSYVIGMPQFIEAYSGYKEEMEEQNCENVRENCYCNDDGVDDQACENQCYEDAGYDYCVEVEGQEDFDMERVAQCDEMEIQNGNYNMNYYDEYGNKRERMFFVGPRCEANKIYLDVFEDNGCTQPAEAGKFFVKILSHFRTLLVERSNWYFGNYTF